MSLQTKIKSSRSPLLRFRNVSACANTVKQGPLSAGRNSQSSDLKCPSRPRTRASKLPVAEVNKAPAPGKRKNKGDSSNISPSSSQINLPSAAKKTKSNKPNGLQQKENVKNDRRTNVTNLGNPNVTGDNAGSPEGGPTDKTEPGNNDVLNTADTNPHDSFDTVSLEPPSTPSVEGAHNEGETSTPGSDFEEIDVPIHPIHPGLPPSKPADPWHLTYNEMRAMSQRMAKLDKIEKNVDTLKTQMTEVVTRTRDLEGAVKNHATDINTIKSETAKQDTSIKDLWTFSNDVASKADQRVRELKEAIQENINKLERIGDVKGQIKEQIDAHLTEFAQSIKEEIIKEIRQEFNDMLKKSSQEARKDIKENVIKEVRQEFSDQIKRNSQTSKKEIHDAINSNAHYCQYTRLQDQASNNRLNLVLLGIRENDRESAYSQASAFFKSSLKLKNISIDVAYRVGQPPAQGSPYNRPIIVRFSYIADRNTVWKKRNNIPQDGQGRSIRIQADLPKQLREDLQILYRVQKAATKIPQYQTAEVKNYKLYLNGEEFFAWELEHLPLPLRPSSLATRKAEGVLVFYSKYSALSNHHYAPFQVRGRSYANMEQFLAYKKAKLSGQQMLINKALLAQDPVEAKAVLNILKNDHCEEWEKEVSAIATEGLHAKFSQNAALGEYLRNTAPLTLGEASRNSRWGVGFTLDNEEVTDKSKWSKQGNLLGRLLMKVRNQMIHARQVQAAADLEKNKQKTPSHPKPKGTQSQPKPSTATSSK